MTSGHPAPALTRRSLTVPGLTAVLLTAVLAWVTLLHGGRADTTGSAVAFVPVWALMMAAMMLPSVTPVASMYARMLRSAPSWRLVLFAAGYLGVWTLTALPAYAASALIRHAVLPHPLAARLTGAVVFAVCGGYQLTPYKDRCLRHCRSPLGQLMRYVSFTGRTRDLRVGVHHAGYCLGCCWALMLVLFALGTMSVAAAFGLAVVIAAEKYLPWGSRLSRVVGVLAVGWAVVVLIAPAAAPGLHPMPAMPAARG